MDLWFALPGHPEVERRAPVYQELLTKSEREQYSQLKLPEHSEEYLLSRALLRTTLARYTGVPAADLQFASNRFGKPELAESELAPGLQFNIAHTFGLVICAVTGGARVGIDAEYHANSRALLEVADDYFSEVEVEDLKRCSPDMQDQYFFRYWTLKESFIKAKGEGLSIPLDSFSFRFDGDQVIFIPSELTVQGGEQWHFELMKPSPQYTAALAVNEPVTSLRLFESVPLMSTRELHSVDELFSGKYHDEFRAGLG